MTKRLFKPLLPNTVRPVPPVRKCRLENRKAVMGEFDPLFNPKRNLGASNYRDLLSLIASEDLQFIPKFTLIEEVYILKL